MTKKLERNIPLSYLFNACTAGLFLIPIWIVYLADFLTLTQMAFFNALFYFFILIFELPTGAFADIYSRKYSLIFGSIFNAVGFILIGLFPSIGMMVVFTLLNGIGVSLISGASHSLVYDSLKELDREDDYPKVSSKLSFYFQLVAAIAIFMGGYVFLVYGGLPYILRGVLYLFAIIPALFLVEPHIDSKKFTLNNYIEKTKDGFREIVKTRYMIKLSLVYILVSGIAMSNQRFFIQAFMLDGGIDDIERGWISSIIKILIAFLTVLLASRKKFFKSKYFLLFLPIIMVVSLVLAPFVSWPLLILVLIGVAFPSGARSTFLGYPVQLMISSKSRATTLSTLNMFVSLVYGANNIIGGKVSEVYGTDWYYFMTGVFVLLVIIPLVLNIVHNNKIQP